MVGMCLTISCLCVYRLFHKHMLQPPFTHRQWAGGEGRNRSEESCSEETRSWTGYPHGTGMLRVCWKSWLLHLMEEDYWGLWRIFLCVWSPLCSCCSSGDTRWNDVPNKDPLQGSVRRCVGRTWDWLHPLHAEGSVVVSFGLKSWVTLALHYGQ